MLYLAENLKKQRMLKNLTQEDVAELLGITPQSVSKWERGESYPDITFLPALANIFETSIDLLIGMDTIRAEGAHYSIHKKAIGYQQRGDYEAAEKTYREALMLYPDKPGMILGLAATLALKGEAEDAIVWMERGLAGSVSEKQRATMRAALCFLYLKAGREDKASQLASELPHMRESREVIEPLIKQRLSAEQLEEKIRILILGEETDTTSDA